MPKYLFLKGQFKKIVSSFEKKRQSRPDSFEIGALVFTGQTGEAEILNEKWANEYSVDEKLLNCFFLALGFIRASRFEKGKRYLYFCFSERHNLKNTESKVFLYQAFGFFDFYRCRYKKSAFWAQRAWHLSVLTDSDFGEFVSTDLLAHALIERGSVQQGFEYLQKAKKIALRLGQTQMVSNLNLSKLIYQSSLGIEPQRTFLALQRKNQEMKKSKDTYSRTTLVLEYANKLILKGKADLAVKALDAIQSDVFTFGHRRQKSTWYFRFAYIEYLRGENSNSLVHLDSALNELDIQHDLSHVLPVLGLKYKIVPSEELLSEITRLTILVDSGVARKYFSRIKKLEPKLSEDKLGNLMDELHDPDSSRFKTVHKICQLNYLQLLRNFLEVSSKRHLFINVLPRALIAFDHGNVELLSNVMTPYLKKILLLLKEGPQSKKDIIETVWGYNYEQHRHDPLIYTSFTRLRKCLGKKASWIIFENDKFRFKEFVGISVFHPAEIKKVNQTLEAESRFQNLNYRQITLITELKSGQYVSIRECMELLKTSKITANRDLKPLLRSGHIRQCGKGKSTRYFI